MTDKKQSDSLIQAAFSMGAGVLISRLLGLVRIQVLAYLFGASHVMDAFTLAFRIPNLLRDLLAEGAMGAALVPVFSKTKVLEGDKRAYRLAGLVFRVLGAVVALLAVLGILFSENIVELYAGGFKAVDGKFELTVHLTKWLFPFFPFVALAAAFMGVLNALGIFFIPAFASALFNLTMIVLGGGLALTADFFGIQPIEGMVIGVVVGGGIQALAQMPLLYKKGYRWQKNEGQYPTWWKDPHLKEMFLLMIPALVGMAGVQLNIWVNSVLAADEGRGAVSWLNYAYRLFQFPIGVFGVSLAAATLPTVSRLWASRSYTEIDKTLRRSLRQVFALNLPASAGLIALSVPMVKVIFEHGAFSADDTKATAMAVSMYAVGLVAVSGVKVLGPACYALGKAKIVVIASLASVVVNIILSLILIERASYWGLALSASIGGFFNFFVLLLFVNKTLKGVGTQLDLLGVSKAFAANALVAVVMGVPVYYLGEAFVSSRWSENFSTELIVLVALVALGALLSITGSALLGYSELWGFIKSKIMGRIRK